MSQANLSLFDREPIVTFAERLIGDDRPAYGADHVHVIHNNSFRTRPGQGISNWHQDEPPYYVVTDGEPPTNVKLPVLLFTCNYYLTDVTTLEQGPTQFVPGSHLFGAAPPDAMDGTRWEDKVVNAYGGAGTAIMFSCQTWHQGCPQPERPHPLRDPGVVRAPDDRASLLPVHELRDARTRLRGRQPTAQKAARVRPDGPVRLSRSLRRPRWRRPGSTGVEDDGLAAGNCCWWLALKNKGDRQRRQSRACVGLTLVARSRCSCPRLSRHETCWSPATQHRGLRKSSSGECILGLAV